MAAENMDNVDLNSTENDNKTNEDVAQPNATNSASDNEQQQPAQSSSDAEAAAVPAVSTEKPAAAEQKSQAAPPAVSDSPQPKKFQFGAIASGVGKALSSTMKKTINAAASAINGPPEQKGSPSTLYRGDYSKDMKTPNWKPSKKVIANPGSIVRRQKRVLVSGGAGFIGSHLVDALMEKGYDVICVDNLFSGQKCNVYKWFGHPNFEWLRHDVCNPLFVEVDEIYHLACPASPVFYQNNPIKTVKTCFVGTMYMLGLAKRVGARILLTSTSEIYGDPKVHPQTEEYWGNVNNIGIRSCYDEGKRISETLMFEYHRQHNVDIAVARIFNTYGPRMLENDGRVVSNFIVQALKGQKLTIYGDGSQTRSFCYIDDQIRGLISLMESGQTGPINIGNPDEYTISQLAKMTVKLVNEKMNKNHTGFVYKDLPSDDPKKRKPDISKAKALLNWTPTISLDEGLSATVDYFIDYFGMNDKEKEKKQSIDNQQSGVEHEENDSKTDTTNDAQ
eukprot:CAMPEP_0197024634 /NCGR_PEP_ID=MMETSP1384-20130603/5143_1 /TAXON_ID=29189 /ORGANISM="Ammonia sp." /LENGTH=504 /DNA_ID=CAMNT_0042453049 /DNA_START=34 /DNA_END=1548 /DNA_ORIENTATION=+